jgi:hypothetical protein
MKALNGAPATFEAETIGLLNQEFFWKARGDHL